MDEFAAAVILGNAGLCLIIAMICAHLIVRCRGAMEDDHLYTWVGNVSFFGMLGHMLFGLVLAAVAGM